MAKSTESNHHPLYPALAAIVGQKYVSDEDFAVYAYSRSVTPFPARIPGIIVRPGTAEEVSDIVKLGNRTSTPVIPRGGGATIGGTPKGHPSRSIILDLTRMDRIIEINQDAMTVTVEAGLLWQKLRTHLMDRGLYTPPPYYSLGIATVGGTLSGVVGGGEVEQWSGRPNGGTYVMDFKVVLPSGDIMHTGSSGSNHLAKSYMRYSHGPEVTGLFVGDQGILGVKVEATLKLSTYPFWNNDCYLFYRLEDIWKATCELSKLECPPVGTFFAMPPAMPQTKPMLDKLGMGDVWTGMLCVVGASKEATDRTMWRAKEICEQNEGMPAPESIKQVSHHVCMGGADIPPNMGMIGGWAFTEYRLPIGPQTLEHIKMTERRLEESKEEFGKFKLSGIFRFFCLGAQQTVIMAPHVFINDPADAVARSRASDFFKAWTRDALLAGAIIHFPQGNDLGDVAAEFYEPHYFDFLRTIKRALDPNNIMNPGVLTI